MRRPPADRSQASRARAGTPCPGAAGEPGGIGQHVWSTRYRESGEVDVRATWRRVARALAAVEGREAAAWVERFERLLAGFAFLPGGRILAGAGSARPVTLFNCFVMGPLSDGLDSLFNALREGAATMQQGGGVGYDFSTLAPRGSVAAGQRAPGPVACMRIWDQTCAALLDTGVRRGAMMATLRCDHPDVEEFVQAKRDRRELRRFNLSLLVSEAFMEAVERDADWPLVFPAAAPAAGAAPAERPAWSGSGAPLAPRVTRTLRARELWARVMRAAYECSEPGVLFIDRINAWNNLAWRERICATNPCGEVPLPAYGACNLGSFNLTRYVRAPFGPAARLDLDALAADVPLAVRMLDDVVDASGFPLQAQRAQALGTRRLGLGITGLADALAMLGLHYDSQQARALAARAMRTLCLEAYAASVELARERGPFPFFEREPYLQARFVRALPEALRAAIGRHGIRNSHLTAIAPAGTISLLAGNVSSGLEPIFALSQRRRLREGARGERELELLDHAWALAGRLGVEPDRALFPTAAQLAPEAHLLMQAALQPWVDNAISKTVNVPADLPFGDFESIYRRAYGLGLKGCTTFRPTADTGAVLTPTEEEASRRCCVI